MTDIFNELIEEWDWEKAKPTGRAVPRKTAHLNGIAHEGVHLWIIRKSETIELLFQHRAKSKDMYPDCLDITVGGHVPFDRKDNKIQKESYEEIGIYPSNNELIDLGYYRYEEKMENFFHREFQKVFLIIDNRALNGYTFMDGEVDGIFAVKLNDLKVLLKKDFNFRIEGYEDNKIIYKNVSRKDFHPLLFADSMKEYMRIIINAAMEFDSDGKVTIKMPSPFHHPSQK